MADEQSPRKAWEQQPDEPAAAYARFQVYLTLGRTRSLELAYASQKAAKKRDKPRGAAKTSISGTWAADCSKYNWVERALAYDIDMLTGKGYETVIDFINTLAILANKTLRAAAQDNIRPKTLKGILELVNILGSFIPAETVAAVRADAEQRRVSAIGSSGSKDEGQPTAQPVRQ